MNFHNNLKHLRNKMNITQKELSTTLSVSLFTFRDWEQGKTQPKYEILEQLTKILDCSYDDLLGDQSKSES